MIALKNTHCTNTTNETHKILFFHGTRVYSIRKKVNRNYNKKKFNLNFVCYHRTPTIYTTLTCTCIYQEQTSGQ